MKEVVYNDLHLPDCKGHVFKKHLGVNDNGDFCTKKIKLNCEYVETISFSYNYEMYHLRISDCISDKLKDYEIVKLYLSEIFDRGTYCFRDVLSIPKWDGEDKVMEVVYFTERWVYCV